MSKEKPGFGVQGSGQGKQVPNPDTLNPAFSGQPDSFGLYLVMTDPVVGYVPCAEAAVRAGVRYLQLRIKGQPREHVLAMARNVAAVTRGSGTRFILNDDPALAVEAGADGVHLGQDDMPLPEARKRFPLLSFFGLSTHNEAQAAAAVALKPDYIGVGPIFATPTKAIPDPVVGLERLGRMVAASPLPCVAIGGIDADNLPAVLKAGARNFAVVRAVCQSRAPFEAILRLQEILNKTTAAL
jgi:thiamine-phosphate pyrophosphorylase